MASPRLGGESTDDMLHFYQFVWCCRALSVRKVEAQQTLGAESGQMSHDVLMDRVALLFQKADTDGNGTLSRAEFQQVGAVCIRYVVRD